MYEPLEAKLARRPKPGAVIQLACYAETLAALQGAEPSRLRLALGDGTQVELRHADYRYLYRAQRDAFLEFMETFDPGDRPAPEPKAEHREWSGEAAAWIESVDHLARVARITTREIAALEATGTRTMRSLAEHDGTPVAGISRPVLDRLRAQARLQTAESESTAPVWEVVRPDPRDPRHGLALLPPASPLDVFLDLEGYPLAEHRLEYLFGAAYVEDGEVRFADWWGHDEAEERLALERFIDWAVERRVRDDTMHVYHYGPYELSALKRLVGAHGTREAELDDLLRHEVFVDLYRVVREGLRIGAPSYSLKDVERLYRAGREGEVGTAVGSIVQYERWLESGEPRDWRRSPLLEEIRRYNRDDCESTRELAGWLRARQVENGLAWLPPGRDEREANAAPRPNAEAAVRLLERSRGGDAGTHDELLGQLVEFHRREDRPMWWAMYDRHGRTEEELVEDFNCLGALRLAPESRDTSSRRVTVYRFEPGQQTKMDVGDDCFLSHDLDLKAQVTRLDLDRGRVVVEFNIRTWNLLGREAPERISLIPREWVPADPIQRALLQIARRWFERGELTDALACFLERRPPSIAGRDGGSLVLPGASAADAVPTLCTLMRGTTLAVQGPPGSGKTTTAAKAIVRLVEDGARVGVTSNSHKAILNLLDKCIELGGPRLRLLKAGGDRSDPFFDRHPQVQRVDTSTVAGLLQTHRLVGGTAWLFSREELEERLDYLFVDEAGQVSVANLVGMSRCARNLVLVGDPMQLPQPIQAAHPGDSGLSTLEYMLGGRATVPPELGVFLDRSFRLHPALCATISDAFYEGKLAPAPDCANRLVLGPGRIQREAGLVFVPVLHEGNTQASDEEVDCIRELVEELKRRRRTDLEGREHRMRHEDILVVAPYNLQVRRLHAALPRGVRVGTVDKFQGQEAPVVIVSMCTSDAHLSPRGLEFLLHPNRLNVALSRAQSLAIVVGHPGLARTRCTTVDQMRLVNLYCRAVDEGTFSEPGVWGQE